MYDDNLNLLQSLLRVLRFSSASSIITT